MVAQQTVANKVRLDDLFDAQEVALREMHRSEARREWRDAAEWRADLEDVRRRIRALTNGRGW